MTEKPIKNLTDRELIDELGSQTLRAMIRRKVVNTMKTIERASQQRIPISPVEVRRREMALAEELIRDITFNYKLEE